MRYALLAIATLMTLALPVLFFSGQTSAVDIFNKTCGDYATQGGKTPVACQDVAAQQADGGNPIIKIITAAISVLSFIIGAAAVIGVLVSSIRLIIANGDSSSVASARNGLIYSIIGVIVAVLAQVLVVFVLSKV